MTTLFQEFATRWRDCTACELCKTRKHVVLCRGKVPCDVLFVGEAPGESEDVCGVPFVGPAGKLLDQIIERSIGEENRLRSIETDKYGRPVDRSLTYALTNLVCCIPRDEDGGKSTEPDDPHIKACSVRLVEFLEIAKPRLVVAVGKLADDYLYQGFKHSVPLPKGTKQVAIVHPAFILRANVAQQSLAIQRCVVRIAKAVEDL